MSNIFPCLRYQDAPAAIEWLVQAFGFEKKAVYPGPEGSSTIAHAELRIGSGLIMLGSAKGDHLKMKTPREAGGVTQGIYIVVPDVDARYERAKAAGAEIVMPPQDLDYGSREFAVRDPEGNLWNFGTYDPGV
jgi:uncharacterized glyoxalase superfamily protein PhnB